MNSECKCCLIKSSPRTETEDVCPNHLKNWETWLERRKRIHEHLEKSVGRPPGKMLMNFADEYRKIKEEHMHFEYSKITTNFDKYRGNPEWWKLSAYLPAKPCQRQLFAVKTQIENNEIPSIDFVGIPQLILNEKNIFARIRNMWMQWQNGDYRKKQLKKLSCKMHEIYPHIPSPENLIIVGKNTISRPELLSLSSESLFGEEGKEQYLCEVPEEIEIVRTAFQINGTTLADNDLLSNSSMTIRVLFEPEANCQKPFVRYIEFVNKGLTTLRVYWNMFKKFRTFREIMPAIPKSSPFYFNNGPLLIVPGKTIYLPIWFKPKTSGNYYEIWQITTIPNFWDEDFKLLVSFESIFYESDVQLQSIKQMLETRVRNTLIQELLSDVLNTVKFEDKPKEPCKITPKQAFETVNQEPYGLKTRSKYEYKQEVVDELTTFYENIRASEDPVVWNYSLKKLKYVAKKRDILDYVDNQISLCKRAAERRAELRDLLDSASKEGWKSFSRKSKCMLEKPTTDVEPASENTNLKRLHQLLLKLEPPLMIKNYDREKYANAYLVFKFYISQMYTVLDSKNYGIFSQGNILPSYNYAKVKTIDDLPDRLIYERFDDVWIERTKRVLPESRIDKGITPKPEILEKIPASDITKIYKTYFAGSASPVWEKVENRKDIKSDKDNISKRSSKSKTKEKYNKASYNTSAPVRAKFDPYAEEYIPCTTTVSQCFSDIDLSEEKGYKSSYQTSNESVSAQNKKNNYYENYIIVYTYLSKAIDAVVDSLETMKESTAYLDEDFHRVLECEGICLPSETSQKPSINKQVTIESQPTDDGEYYNYLLDMNLYENEKVQTYLLEGKKSIPRNREVEISHEAAKEIATDVIGDILEAIPSRSHHTLHSAGAQTSFESYEVNKNQALDDTSTQKESLLVKMETFDLDNKQSYDMFYFMKDCAE